MERTEDYLKRQIENAGYSCKDAKDLVDQYIVRVKSNIPESWGEEGWERYLDAVIFAARAHAGATRKKTEIPYIFHPIEASVIALDMTEDIDLVIGAVLHDVVEDTHYSIEYICERFGDRIAELVGNETEDKRPEMDKKDSWRIRKEEFLEHLQGASEDSMIITLSDKLSNMRSLCRDYEKVGDELWQRFNQKDIKQQEWYYRSIAEKTKIHLADTDSWKEYVELCDQIFKNSTI